MTTQSDAPAGQIEILPGVRHYQTSGFALTWEAYDAFTSTDGWIERTYNGSIWKEGTVNGRSVSIFSPHRTRSAASTDEFSVRRS